MSDMADIIFPMFNKVPEAEFAEFELVSPFAPMGDQIEAIAQLSKKVNENERNQVLLGVTGSGKTFTMANVIKNTGRPTLIMAPNKTLAAQLYSEMKEFFPNNHVEYFVSYYDYYQPEAYIPTTNTYIEKDASINEQIDRMRHSATRALLEHNDVIIVSSVSCLYGLGDPVSYSAMRFTISKGQKIKRDDFIDMLVELQYTRNDLAFSRGTFRVKGDTMDVFPPHSEDRAYRFSMFGDEIESISEIDWLTSHKHKEFKDVTIYPNSHHITPRPTLDQAMVKIKHDLQIRLAELKENNKLLEFQRLEEKTQYDLEMMEATGSCKGIENYSRYFTGREVGMPPPTLFEYLPENALLIVDESHIAIGQIRGMYLGDKARKDTLVQYGFRLPAAKDNRPLKFEEWEAFRPSSVFVSATPADWELGLAGKENVAEQIIRPTGLLDPEVEVRKASNQVDDFIDAAKKAIANNGRVLCTTLTKKMAEQLSSYLDEVGVKAKYMHSDIDTLERIEIINELRSGGFDVLVGINLLREGLDIPECKLVCIMDADKEGFLRSDKSLIQTIGRAARNSESKVILYADVLTGSITRALEETTLRRNKQMKYNEEHGITPKTIIKPITSHLKREEETKGKKAATANILSFKNQNELEREIKKLRKQMFAYADNLEFEKATELREKIKELESQEISLG